MFANSFDDLFISLVILIGDTFRLARMGFSSVNAVCFFELELLYFEKSEVITTFFEFFADET